MNKNPDKEQIVVVDDKVTNTPRSRGMTFRQVSQQAMVELQDKFSKDAAPSVPGHKRSNG